MTQVAFFVDVNRCTGCRTCEIACKVENGVEIFHIVRDLVLPVFSCHPRSADRDFLATAGLRAMKIKAGEALGRHNQPFPIVQLGKPG